MGQRFRQSGAYAPSTFSQITLTFHPPPMSLLCRATFGLLLSLVLSSPAAAQDAARARGDSLRLAGDLAGAVAAYRDVLSRTGDDGDAAYALASTYALQPQYSDSAFHYLDLALAHEDTVKPLQDPDLYFLIDDERWAQVETRQLDKLATRVAGPFDRAYARQLLRIRMSEWAFRYHIMLAHRQIGPESPILTALAKAMSEHHDANLVRLRRLLQEKGWPELSAVGEEAAYAAGNVINHADLATRQHYLPLLEAACERGEGDWSRYAHIRDRTELELGNPQVYGTQMELDEKTGRYEPRPMVDPGRVDERRAEKGMEPIDEQLRRFNESMQRDFGTSDKKVQE